MASQLSKLPSRYDTKTSEMLRKTSNSDLKRFGVIKNKKGTLDFLAPKPDGKSETNTHVGYKARAGQPQYRVRGTYNVVKKKK